MSNLFLFPTQEKARPFLRWAGGKRRIMKALAAHIPTPTGDYHEPFLGGGSVFFSIGYKAKKAYISDAVPDLIHAYQCVQKDPAHVHALLTEHNKNHSKEYFYSIRDTGNTSWQRASNFIYVNLNCFQGLHTRLRNGNLNCPFSYNETAIIPSIGVLLNAQSALKNAEISWQDFSDISPKSGDVVYLDPPYHASFSQYTQDGFSEEMHIKLRDLCEEWRRIGAHVIVSNSATDFIKDLFKDWRIIPIMAKKTIGPKEGEVASYREIIATSF